MFTQKCFISKNTKEITSIIENIGYKLLFSARKNEGKYLVCANKFCFGQDDKIPDNYIDCGDNEELFLAIAALRDDSNEHQWYTDGTRWNFNKLDTKYDWMIDDSWHKATVEELIKHFNNK